MALSEFPQQSAAAQGPLSACGAAAREKQRRGREYLPQAGWLGNLAVPSKPAHAGAERGIAGDDKQVAKFRQIGNDVVGNSIAEILLRWVPAQVSKR